MRSNLVVIGLLVFLTVFLQVRAAEAVEFVPPTVGVAAGIRLGGADSSLGQAGYFGARFHGLRLLTEAGPAFYSVSVLSPGINFQTDKHFTFSFSAISVSTNRGFTYGIDIFPITNTPGVAGGVAGISIGYTFGN